MLANRLLAEKDGAKFLLASSVPAAGYQSAGCWLLIKSYIPPNFCCWVVKLFVSIFLVHFKIENHDEFVLTFLSNLHSLFTTDFIMTYKS